MFDETEIMAGQTSLFDKPVYKIDKPIRLIELFGGIGAQARALERIGADFEHYKMCEFDRFAVSSYNAVHGTDFKVSDISELKASDLEIVDTNKYCYIMTYSFPCQDLSVAGAGKGMAKGSNTRSGLLWEVERLLNECDELPQVLIMENVPQVHGKKNMVDFNEWTRFLETKGYSNYWKDLNAKDYGVPQNRNRCFMVSILGNYKYEFPGTVKLDRVLKDVLEHNVDEKFYIRSEKAMQLIEKLIVDGTFEGKTKEQVGELENSKINVIGTMDNTLDHTHESANRVYGVDGISPTVAAHSGGGLEPKIVCGLGEKKSNGGTQYFQQDRVYSSDGVAMCHPASIPGGSYKYLVKEATKKGYDEAVEGDSINLSYPSSKTRRGRVQKQLSHTLTSDCDEHVVVDYKIRKLTPKECWRLMGFDDEDFEKAKQVNSNSQLYKQAGNSIVVNVLEAIFSQLL